MCRCGYFSKNKLFQKYISNILKILKACLQLLIYVTIYCIYCCNYDDIVLTKGGSEHIAFPNIPSFFPVLAIKLFVYT